MSKLEGRVRGSPFSSAFYKASEDAFGLFPELVNRVTGVTLYPQYHILLRVLANVSIASMLFPVMPASVESVRKWYTTIVPTVGGGFVHHHRNPAPFPFTLQGDFGVRPRVVYGQISGEALQKAGMLPLGGALMTGFGLAKTLEAICDISHYSQADVRSVLGIQTEDVPVETWLYLWPLGIHGEVVITDLRFGLRAAEPRLTNYTLTGTFIRRVDNQDPTVSPAAVAGASLRKAQAAAAIGAFASGMRSAVAV